MRRVLFCWELGQGYGHIAGFLPLAERLREKGFEVVFALKDLYPADALLVPKNLSFVQAPIWQHRPVGLPEPVNYAEILIRIGYHDPGKLYGMVAAWRRLYAALDPQLLIADHGPTALLAARGLGVPRAMFGNGFASPPRMSPFPSFRPWEKLHPQRLPNSEKQIRRNVNQVLRDLDVPEIGRLADLFDVDEDFLCTLPELEHYPERGAARYWGPRVDLDSGQECSWPNGKGPKIFAYLRPSQPNFADIVAQLCDAPYRVILHAPGLSRRNWKGPWSNNLLLAEQAIKLRPVLDECDLVISYAGHGTVAGVLLAGRPLLLLPAHLEQQLLANRVVQLGAGLAVLPNQKADYLEMIRTLIETPDYRQSAERFAEKYARFNDLSQYELMSERCLELLSEAG